MLLRVVTRVYRAFRKSRWPAGVRYGVLACNLRTVRKARRYVMREVGIDCGQDRNSLRDTTDDAENMNGAFEAAYEYASTVKLSHNAWYMIKDMAVCKNE